MNKWPKKKLGDLLRLRKEVVHPRDQPSGPATFVGLEHIESHTGKQIGSLNVEMSQLTGRKPRFYKGDIVYGYLRPYLNKVWLAEFDGLCSVDQYVYAVRPDVADPTFLAWFMRSQTYLLRAPINTTPGQLPRIRTEEVAAVGIEVPPFPEQRRIAAALTAQMAQVARMRAAAERQLAACRALPAAYLREVFESEEARRWGRKKLGDFVASFKNGFGRRPIGMEEGPFVLRLADVSSGLIDLTIARRTAMSADEIATYKLEHGDLLFIRVNGSSKLVGRAVIVEEYEGDFVFNDHLIRVRLRDGLAPDYLRAVCDGNEAREHMVNKSTTSAGQLTINQNTMASLEIPIPPLPTQRRVVAQLNERMAQVEQMRNGLERQREAIAALPGVLLNEVFGE